MNLLERTSEYVTNLYEGNNPIANKYHVLEHTISTVSKVEEIGMGSKVSEDELEILIIAAWFHDTGYIDSSEKHEIKSCEYAENFLLKENYQHEKIEKIKSIIMATEVPQNPKILLEKIICDADLSHLGEKKYNKVTNNLRLELEAVNKKMFTDYEWLKFNIDFFEGHNFFTDYAKHKYNGQKNINYIKLKKKLHKEEERLKTEKLKEQKFQLEKDKIKNKDKTAGRGIETMFRNVMRTHVSFSSMADSKANIMISVNTLILTAVVTFLIRKLDANQHLIIPTIILIIVSLLSLTFAVFVTRPKVTKGQFTNEDILTKEANLLFFGNFYKMELDDFTWGMKKTIDNKDYLYESMIKDFYSLGKVLGKKYHYLRICYNTFMFGLIVSVFAFAMAVLLYPNGIKADKELTKKGKIENSIFDIRDLIE